MLALSVVAACGEQSAVQNNQPDEVDQTRTGPDPDKAIDAFNLLFFGTYDGLEMFEQDGAMVVMRKLGRGDYHQTNGKVELSALRTTMVEPCIFHVERTVDGNPKVVGGLTVDATLLKTYTLADKGQYKGGADGLHIFVAEIEASDGFLTDGTGSFDSADSFVPDVPSAGPSLLTDKPQSELEVAAARFRKEICPPTGE